MDKIKYVRLTAPERLSVVKAFKEPLELAALRAFEQAQIAPGKAVYDAAYPPEIQKLLPLLEKHGFVSGATSIYVYPAENGDRTGDRVKFGKTYKTLNRNDSPRVPKALIAAAQEVERVYEERQSEIEMLGRGIDSAARACKTRFEFGQVWPALYDLMGTDWVEALADGMPACLPVVINLDAATAAVATIKKAA